MIWYPPRKACDETRNFFLLVWSNSLIAAGSLSKKFFTSARAECKIAEQNGCGHRGAFANREIDAQALTRGLWLATWLSEHLSSKLRSWSVDARHFFRSKVLVYGVLRCLWFAAWFAVKSCASKIKLLEFDANAHDLVTSSVRAFFSPICASSSLLQMWSHRSERFPIKAK